MKILVINDYAFVEGGAGKSPSRALQVWPMKVRKWYFFQLLGLLIKN